MSESFSAYLAPEGFVDELVKEVGEVTDVYDRLVISPQPARKLIWAENSWLNPQWIEISSIGDAAKKLRSLQRNWWNYDFDFHRRSGLITEKLPHVGGKPLKFGQPLITAPLGSWTLVKENLLLASPACSEPVPNGAYVFDEDKAEPPNRAYLKLWEALTRCGKMPKPGETCIDFGSAPGGWTWVLHQLGASVISVDKAPLAPNIAKLPRVKYLEQSAFAVAAKDTGPVDWLFSDVICYPERLFRLVSEWREKGYARNFVTTIKLQGDTDFSVIQPFLDIEGSYAIHLYHNKHEITWFSLEKPA
ncbi:MAG TPA: SAM-dependent methyltransferase [Patescibacteria group bacterium]|nr:SAM-dependent methyltransferase [Patescibacteria group bacterium]